MAFESVKRWFGRGPERAVGERLYAACVDQARDPVFYERLGVPDTMEGRFDLLVLHVFLVVRNLPGDGGPDPLGQAVFDALMRDLDGTYREMGFGDAKVARKVREDAERFFGRSAAYGRALDTGDEAALSIVLARNVYGGDTADARRLSGYVRRSASMARSALRAGRADFPGPAAD